MKHVQLLIAVAGISVLASCQVNYQKTASGLTYKIIPGKLDSPKLKPGEYVKFDIEYSIPEKDTILNSTFGKIPGYSPIDTGARTAYTVMELLPKCSVGDQLEFDLSIDTLKNKGAIADYNKTFARGGHIHAKIKILKSFLNEKDIIADYQKESEKEKDRETQAIQDYLTKKGIKAQKTSDGIFAVIQQAGNPAQMADSGKQVSIMYKGYLLTDGKVFDTNLDSSKGHTDPFKFVLGQRSVIPGWEDGLKLFGKGGKGTLYIPAMLGYGPQGSPPTIPAYSNLVFDVEVNDVTDAPKVPAGQNQMHLTPEQMQQLEEEMQRQHQGSGH